MSDGADRWQGHPRQATDLVWWVLLDDDVYFEDPVDDPVESAVRLEYWTGRIKLEEERGRLSMRRMSRAWGFEHLTGS